MFMEAVEGVRVHNPTTRSPTSPPPHRFCDLMRQLNALVPFFDPLASNSHLVLHHSDLALCNVLFDPSDYSKTVSVFDWSGAQIIPLILSARYPSELMSTPEFPFCKEPFVPLHETWSTVPREWTFHRTGPGITEESNLRVHREVGRFYLRSYHRICFARAMYDLHDDSDVLRTSVFADAPYHLKFHEVLSGSYGEWFARAPWIKETFARAASGRMGRGSGKVVVGPNVYAGSAEQWRNDVGFVEADTRLDTRPGLDSDEDTSGTTRRLKSNTTIAMVEREDDRVHREIGYVTASEICVYR